MKRIKISVVTVTFNARKTLEFTIKSVLSQTYDNMEYIVVDGNSSDGTVELLINYSNKLKWISEPDKGVYDAMNKARQIASGDYLFFLGADDVFHNNTVVEDLVNEIHSVDDVYYGNVIFKGPDKIYWGKFNKWKWGCGNISHQAIFYPRHVYKNISYDIKYKVFADYVYNLSLLENKTKFNYIPLIITDYATDGFSATTRDLAFEKDKYSLVRKSVGIFPVFVGVTYHFLRKLKDRLKN